MANPPCVRILNHVTSKDRFPFPCIDNQVDVAAGFHQPGGQFEYMRMLFDLDSTTSILQSIGR